MNEVIKVTICAIKDDDRINFNFTNKDYSETWCIGPKINSINFKPVVGRNIKIIGHWVSDASGSKVFFHATHLEDCSE